VTERRAIRAAAATGLAVAALAVALAGCGLNVQQPDLFLLTRTGQGQELTLLPNDSGTISCDGGKARTLPDTLLIEARDLAQDLDQDARRGLTIKSTAGTVFNYRIKLEHGTISFPDSAARTRKELSQATLFAAQAAQRACGLSG
jgi:hypothetical protein